jgi:hypothetical protein
MTTFVLVILLNIIKLVIKGAFALVKLFFLNFIAFESIAFGLAVGLVLNKGYPLFNFTITEWIIHPALTVGIVLAVAAVLYFPQRTKIGFWLIGSLTSLVWGAITGLLFTEAVFNDLHPANWQLLVVGSGGVAVAFALHMIARRRMTGKATVVANTGDTDGVTVAYVVDRADFEENGLQTVYK